MREREKGQTLQVHAEDRSCEDSRRWQLVSHGEKWSQKWNQAALRSWSFGHQNSENLISVASVNYDIPKSLTHW